MAKVDSKKTTTDEKRFELAEKKARRDVVLREIKTLGEQLDEARIKQGDTLASGADDSEISGQIIGVSVIYDRMTAELGGLERLIPRLESEIKTIEVAATERAASAIIKKIRDLGSRWNEAAPALAKIAQEIFETIAEARKINADIEIRHFFCVNRSNGIDYMPDPGATCRIERFFPDGVVYDDPRDLWNQHDFDAESRLKNNPRASIHAGPALWTDAQIENQLSENDLYMAKRGKSVDVRFNTPDGVKLFSHRDILDIKERAAGCAFVQIASQHQGKNRYETKEFIETQITTSHQLVMMVLNKIGWQQRVYK